MACFQMQNMDESPVYISVISGGIGFNFAEIILTADQDGEMMSFNVTIGGTCDTHTGPVDLQTPSVSKENHEPANLPLEPPVGEHGEEHEHPHNSADDHSDPALNATIVDEIPIAQEGNAQEENAQDQE